MSKKRKKRKPAPSRWARPEERSENRPIRPTESDVLIDRYRKVDFGLLKPYSIVVRDPASPDLDIVYPAQRGLVMTLQLNPDGSMTILRQRPHSARDGLASWNNPRQLEGDYWLVMKEQFFGAVTFVPFIDGVIVVDKSAWITAKD